MAPCLSERAPRTPAEANAQLVHANMDRTGAEDIWGFPGSSQVGEGSGATKDRSKEYPSYRVVPGGDQYTSGLTVYEKINPSDKTETYARCLRRLGMDAGGAAMVAVVAPSQFLSEHADRASR